MSVFDSKGYVFLARSANLAFQWILYPGRMTEARTTTKRVGYFRLRMAMWGLATLLGFAHAWANRYELLSSDGLSYFDIATAYLRGDWSAAINAYWSPLYSWLLAAALWIFRPSAYWELSVTRLVNWVIFLFAMACFDFLLREFLRWRQSKIITLPEDVRTNPPQWVFLILGYSLFIWFTIFQIKVSQEHPDVLLSGFVYLAVGLLLRIQRGRTSWAVFAGLGVTLGIGYLAKMVMFPLAFVFVLLGLFAVGKVAQALPRALLAMGIFLLVAAPFMIALSKSKGRLTFGETGKLAYVWYINLGWVAPDYTTLYWEGSPAVGSPVHPLRKVHELPAVYEFGSPVGGTYPPWYDPSYWYEGVRPHPALTGQVRRLAVSAQAYYESFFHTAQFGLLIAILFLYLVSDQGRLRSVGRHWVLILPGILVMGMYSLVWVEPRFIAAFLVIFWLGLFSGVRLSGRWQSSELSTKMVLSITSFLFILLIGSSASEIASTMKAIVRGEQVVAHQNWQIANELKLVGTQPGEPLAILGRGFHAYWARLAELKIVAEVPYTEAYWGADDDTKASVMEALAKCGAKYLVAREIPVNTNKTGWQKVGRTGYFIFFLARDRQPNAAQ